MSTSTLRQRAFRANAVRPAGNRRVGRNRIAVKAGLFDFLKAGPAAPKQNPRTRELVDELLELCVPTDAGLKVTPAARERIEALAEELQQYCIRNPVKSPLLWGEYEVVYTGNPKAIAGPFRQGAGMTIFPGQKPKQVLQAPNVFINDLQYKTLGFLDGYARQFGEIEITSGSTFKVTLQRQELNTGVGLSQKKDITAYRNFEVIYLDDDVRVTRFLPVEGLRDDERDADGQQRPPSPPTLFVYKRVKVEAEAAPEEEDAGTGSSEEPVAGTVLARLRLPGTELLRPKRLEGAATLTERQVRRQMEEDNRRGRGGTGQTAPRAGTAGTRPAAPEPKQKGAAAADAKKKQQEAARAAAEKQRQGREAAAEKERKAREAAAEKQRQEREAIAARERQAKEAAAEKERKAREAAAEKQRREAEAAAAREKQAAIRNLLAQLSQELKEKAAAKKDALTDLKAIERGNTNVLRAAAAARSKVEAAAATAANAEEALDAAKQAQQEAAQQLRESEAELKEVQKGTQKVLAGTTRTRR